MEESSRGQATHERIVKEGLDTLDGMWFNCRVNTTILTTNKPEPPDVSTR